MSDHICYDYINHYITRTLHIPHNADMLAYAKAHDVPVARDDTVALLRTLCAAKAGQVLEVGTAIGYTAWHMSPLCAHIDTIELCPNTAAVARNFLAGCNNVDIHVGDASEILHTLGGLYDLIFLDADKGGYPAYLPLLLPRLSPRGILVSDNVLYQGMVASDDVVMRRKITIVKRLRMYLDTLCNLSGYATSILSIGDGVALTVPIQVQAQGQEEL